MKSNMRNKKTHKGECPDLPLDLLGLILKRLPLQDYLRFGSVCRSWRIAEKQRLHQPAPQLPWLMLHKRSSTSTTWDFFSLSEKRIYKISSSQGWLMTEDMKVIKKKSVRNLFPKDQGASFHYDILLSTPTDHPEILIVRRAYNESFLFYRLKDDEWGQHKHKLEVCSNVISCKGKLYGLDEENQLVVVDLEHEPVEMKLQLEGTPERKDSCDSFLLVESCGEILAVSVRGGRCNMYFPHSNSFKVFRLDLSEMKWVTIEKLGDRILFLSEISSISVSAAETGGRGNQIYYIPHNRRGIWLEFDFGSRKPLLEHKFVDYDGEIEKTWVTPSLRLQRFLSG